jgi:uncharacterized membrane protein YfcA
LDVRDYLAAAALFVGGAIAAGGGIGGGGVFVPILIMLAGFTTKISVSLSNVYEFVLFLAESSFESMD